MKEAIKWTLNRMPKSDDQQLSVMSLSNVAKARFFHSSFPQYSITPLDQLSGMAAYPPPILNIPTCTKLQNRSR